MANTTPAQVIQLNKLRGLTQQNGVTTVGAVTIQVPTPCKQPNAPGLLRSFDSIESFREAAKETGKRFREAMIAPV